MLKSKSTLIEHMITTLDWIELDDPAGCSVEYKDNNRIEIKGVTRSRIPFCFHTSLNELKNVLGEIKNALWESDYWPGALSSKLTVHIVMFDEKTLEIIECASTYREADEKACELWVSKRLAVAVTTVRTPMSFPWEKLIGRDVREVDYI